MALLRWRTPRRRPVRRRRVLAILRVEYKGAQDMLIDRLIEKIVGRDCDGSGFDFTRKRRDLSFPFSDPRAAERARVRLLGTRKMIKARVLHTARRR